MTLTAELTFQKILSSIELDSDCVVTKLQQTAGQTTEKQEILILPRLDINLKWNRKWNRFSHEIAVTKDPQLLYFKFQLQLMGKTLVNFSSKQRVNGFIKLIAMYSEKWPNCFIQSFNSNLWVVILMVSPLWEYVLESIFRRNNEWIVETWINWWQYSEKMTEYILNVKKDYLDMWHG